MQIPVPGEVEQIIEKLHNHGYEAFAVGGCVRDTLLGRRPEDWDITTSARPEQTKALFCRTIDTGIRHGTVTVMLGNTGYEVTTYRIDGEYEDGRHPNQVEFTADLREDLRRRDFTINAMAYNHRTGIVDVFGGMDDLEKGIIRCVGSADKRFDEDALRILRAIRFSAQLGFVVEEATWSGIKRAAPKLAKISKERIQAELGKILLSSHPEQITQVYETGMAAYVSPAFGRIPCREICIPAALPPKKYIRWAAFLRPAGSGQAARILEDLKMDNDTIGKVKTLVSWSGVPVAAEPAAVRKAMSRMEAEVWDAVCCLNGYGPAVLKLTDQIRENGDCLTLRELAVSGRDLTAAGAAPGKKIGETLNRMLEWVLEHPEANNKDSLLEKFPLE